MPKVILGERNRRRAALLEHIDLFQKTRSSGHELCRAFGIQTDGREDRTHGRIAQRASA